MSRPHQKIDPQRHGTWDETVREAIISGYVELKGFATEVGSGLWWMEILARFVLEQRVVVDGEIEA